MRKIILIFFVLGLLNIVLGVAYLTLHPKSAPAANFPWATPVGPTQLPPLPSPFEITEDGFPHLLYLKNMQIFKLHPDGYKQVVTSPDINVYSFAYAPKKNVIAYIAGKKFNDNKPEEVVLQDLASGKATQLLVKKEVDYPGSEYVMRLVSVAFSDDGTKLAITSTDSLWIYDLETKELRQVFSKPWPASAIKGSVGNKIFAYSNVTFSPNNALLLLYKVYYEGNNQVVLDTSTGEFFETSKYSSGTPCPVTLFAWKSNTDLYGVNQYGECIDNSPTSFFTSQVPGYQETKRFDEKHRLLSYDMVGKDLIYIRAMDESYTGYEVVRISPDGKTTTWAIPKWLGRINNPKFSSDEKLLFFDAPGQPQYQDPTYPLKTGTYVYDLTQPDKGPNKLIDDFDGHGTPYVIMGKEFNPNE